MKKLEFIEAEVEIVLFDNCDVITTSELFNGFLGEADDLARGRTENA